MKQLIVFGVFLSFGVIPVAIADCSPSSQVIDSDLENLINGNTVCANFGGDEWQEQHRAGGQLWDYKKGPSDSIDPSEQVGTWGIANNQVTYTYGSNSYGYTVHDEGGGTSYTFCGVSGGAPVITGAQLVTSASCP